MFNDSEKSPLVLVVDDDVFMREMLQNLLEEQGYEVVQAHNGQQALDCFEKCLPDLVLLDASMPIMDGFTACAKLKQLEAALDVPVVMITSLDDENSVDKAFEAGAVEYITKPVHWTVLRHRVQVILKARRAEAALKRSEARFRGIFEQAAMGIALVSLDGVLISTNPMLQHLLGQNDVALCGKAFHKLFYPADTVIEKEFHQQLLQGERNFYQMEKYFFSPKSSMAWARITTSLVHNAENEPQFVIQMIEDVTERKRARLKQQIATKVFETTSDGIMITNAEGRIIDVNQAFLLATGYSYNEVLDKNPRFLKSGGYETSFYAQIWDTTRETGRWRGEICNQRKNGESYNVWLSMSAVRGEHHEIVYYVAVYSDISALHPDDERMRLLTHYDTLTELPNRLLFHEYITRSCHQEEKFAVLYLDLEDFKSVNELLGFDAGDECLREVAKRLRSCLSEGDYLSRFEGDEFMILLGNVQQDYDARLVAEKIFMSLENPIISHEHPLQLDCNIGISLYPNDNCEDKTAEQRVGILLQQADVALFIAKEAGKNMYRIFSELVASV